MGLGRVVFLGSWPPRHFCSISEKDMTAIWQGLALKVGARDLYADNCICFFYDWVASKGFKLLRVEEPHLGAIKPCAGMDDFASSKSEICFSASERLSCKTGIFFMRAGNTLLQTFDPKPCSQFQSPQPRNRTTSAGVPAQRAFCMGQLLQLGRWLQGRLQLRSFRLP